MPQLKIAAASLHSNGFYWSVQTPQGWTYYEHSSGAFTYARKYMLRNRKEMSAFSMLNKISINLCTFDEAELIRKLIRNSCKGITKAQYGWLVGIYERQERAW
jgi:hypothetical protein